MAPRKDPGWRITQRLRETTETRSAATTIRLTPRMASSAMSIVYLRSRDQRGLRGELIGEPARERARIVELSRLQVRRRDLHAQVLRAIFTGAEVADQGQQ